MPMPIYFIYAADRVLVHCTRAGNFSVVRDTRVTAPLPLAHCTHKHSDTAGRFDTEIRHFECPPTQEAEAMLTNARPDTMFVPVDELLLSVQDEDYCHAGDISDWIKWLAPPTKPQDTRTLTVITQQRGPGATCMARRRVKPSPCDVIECPRHSKKTIADVEGAAGAAWYEHLPADSVSNVFFDIDLRLNTTCEAEFSRQRQLIEPTVLPTIMSKLECLGVKQSDLALSHSCGLKPASKPCAESSYVLSYHVVVNTLCCERGRMAAALAHLGFQKDAECGVLSGFDEKPYAGKTACMRLIGMAKSATDRRQKVALTHLENTAAHIITIVDAGCTVLDEALIGVPTGALDTPTPARTVPPKRARASDGPVEDVEDLPAHVQAFLRDLPVTSIAPHIRMQDGAPIDTGQIIIRIKPGVCECPFAGRVHASETNYFLYSRDANKLVRKCHDAHCQGQRRVEAMGSTELAFYSDFRTRRMNNTESVATLDAYLTGCFVYKDTLRTKSWFARTRDDDGVPYYEECKIRPYSTLDNGDLYTYAVYEKVVDKKSKNKTLVAKRVVKMVGHRLLELTKDCRIRHYGGDTFVPYLVGADRMPRWPEDVLNTFAGFRCEYHKLDSRAILELESGTLRTFFRVFDNLVDGERQSAPTAADAAITYHRQFVADIIQNPAKKPGVELAYRSKQGIGKDSVWAAIMACIGRRFCKVNNLRDRMVSRFNGWMTECLVILCSDMNASGNDVQLSEAMKSYITEEDVLREDKGKEARLVRTYMRFVRANNETLDVSSATGRRNNTLSCGDVLPPAVYTALWKQMQPDGEQWDQGFLDELFLYFANVDLTGFRPSVFPFTREARCQAWFSGDKNVVIVRVVMAVISGHVGDAERIVLDHDKGNLVVTKKALYRRFTEARGREDEPCKIDMFGKRVQTLFRVTCTQLQRVFPCPSEGGGTTGYTIPFGHVAQAITAIDPTYPTARWDAPTPDTEDNVEFEDQSPVVTRIMHYEREMFN